MAATFGGAALNSPILVDAATSQFTGALSTGIGQGVGLADGNTATLLWRIGSANPPTEKIRVETDANLATP